MANIAFIGLGNMGGPMSSNLVKAQHKVRGFDLVADLRNAAEKEGVQIASSAQDAVKAHLRTLFENYLAYQDPTTEKALAEAMAEIDENYYDRTRERIDDIAQSVKSIFDQDQLAALSQRFGPRND